MPLMSQPKRPLMAAGQPLQYGAPGLTPSMSGVQREVQGNELTSTHLNELTKPTANNRYLENLKQGARQSYAARGGLNTTLAAAGAEDVGLRAAGDIAAQDAGVYAQTAGQNMDAAANRERLQMQLQDNREQQELAYVRNNMGRLDAMAEAERERQFRREEREAGFQENARERDWRTSEGREGRTWQSQENQAQRDYDWNSQEAQTRSAFIFRAVDTVMQDPDFWRDPQAAQGFMNFWAEEAPNLFRGVFNRPRSGG